MTMDGGKDPTNTGPPSDDEQSIFHDDDNRKPVDPEERSLELAEDDSSFLIDLENGKHLDADEHDEIREIQKLAKRETRRVCIWKTILIVIVVIAAASVTAGSYQRMTQSESKDYEDAYELFSNTIKDSIQEHYSNHRLALKGAASSISGAAIANDETFPFVTLKDFEVLGQTVRAKSGIEVFAWVPHVKADQESEWLSYSQNNQGWINVSRDIMSRDGSQHEYVDQGIPPYLLRDPNTTVGEVFGPIWQLSPPPFSNWAAINLDWFSQTNEWKRYDVMTRVLRHEVFVPVEQLSYLSGTAVNAADHEAFHEQLVDWKREANTSVYDHPHSLVMEPVFEVVNDRESDIVGQVEAVIAWDYYLVDLLPEGVSNISVTLENTCGQSFTYLVGGRSAFYLGPGDLHEHSYDDKDVHVDFYEFDDEQLVKGMRDYDVCVYSFHIHPTKAFEDSYKTNLPIVIAFLVGSAFLFMAISFFMYDWFVQSRNQKVTNAAANSNAIISSMFPAQIREQLLQQKKREREVKKAPKNRTISRAAMGPSEHHLGGAAPGSQPGSVDGSRPIADYYKETTIMFSDIVGFTAWSSVREPTQVFELLEAIYAEFDGIARMRRVFKVETVGDCYVAVAGLPEPRKDHAISMARFARDCNQRFQAVVRRLEITLGPDTADLAMRFGLHSGPVTAGVLRGERTRFQLFGDTMNTASRMESTGKPNRIQVSQDTADLIKAGGKESWVSPREDMVQAKGKGMMVTYWLSGSRTTSSSNSRDGRSSDNGSVYSLDSDQDGALSLDDSGDTAMTDLLSPLDPRTNRLCQWSAEVMGKILRQIQAQRDPASLGKALKAKPRSSGRSSRPVLGEVREVIALSPFKDNPNKDPQLLELDKVVEEQLRSFVAVVASMYRANPFHNFEHASHVTMAVVKLMSRVVNPKINGIYGKGNTSSLHDYTFGITSDPLVQFACVFAAIVHDVDHPGVPNATLVRENANLTQVYERSAAEQNSFDLAWDLFTDPQFLELRSAVCGDAAGLKRFRQILINLIMATDVLDKELNEFRAERWGKAFAKSSDSESSEKEKMDRKATIVLEHMLQGADVSHTMQHWHVFRKWNARLFLESYQAWEAGHSEEDPSLNWYQGELNFFDHYVTPLAKKLAECGVFGESSSEYLTYAEQNRKEWEDRGQQIVAEYVEEAKSRSIQEQQRTSYEEIGKQIEFLTSPLKQATPTVNNKAVSNEDEKIPSVVHL